jgi:hypothetical protein
MWAHQIVSPGLGDVGKGQLLLAVEEELEHPRRRQRQLLNPLSRRVRHRAGDGRADIQDWHFACALRAQGSDRRRAFVKAYLDWHDMQRQGHAVGLEAVLTDAPIRADRHFFVQGVSQSLHNAALNLTPDRARIQRAPDVLTTR